jgi:hypothetical protein
VDPARIYLDAFFPDRENYYRILPPLRGRYRAIKVVVLVNRTDKTGYAKTAMIVDAQKQGESQIWPPKAS